MESNRLDFCVASQRRVRLSASSQTSETNCVTARAQYNLHSIGREHHQNDCLFVSSKRETSLPNNASHMMIVASSESDAMRSPFGEKSMDVTVFLWPCEASCPVPAYHNRIRESLSDIDVTVNRRPSEEKAKPSTNVELYHPLSARYFL